MRNFTPYFLILIGLLVAFIATLFGFANGSALQYPSIETLVSQSALLRKYNLIALFGLLACMGGIFWSGARALARRRKRKI